MFDVPYPIPEIQTVLIPDQNQQHIQEQLMSDQTLEWDMDT